MLCADHSRQALGAASTWQQAELYFRQGNLGIRFGDAVVTTQGQFQTAAHAGAADGRNHRFAAAFHVIDYGE